MLKKTDILFSRDEKGQLIPQEVELVIDEKDDYQKQFIGEKIIITPMSRGEIKRLFASAGNVDVNRDLDAELVEKHCIEPVFTREELEHVKQSHVTMIVNTILEHSGLKVSSGSRKKDVEKIEDEFAKN